MTDKTLETIKFALEQAAFTFTKYKEHHALKNTEDALKKSFENEALAVIMQQALTELNSYIEATSREAELLATIAELRERFKIIVDYKTKNTTKDLLVKDVFIRVLAKQALDKTKDIT